MCSSWLTKVGSARKAQLEEHHREGGQRDWWQVLTNSVVGVAVALVYFLWVREDSVVDYRRQFWPSFLWMCYLGHYACTNGDTWSSELGVLSTSPPRLVTSCWRRVVPPGTNGGMSLLGTGASVAGGAFIGAVFVLLGGWTTEEGWAGVPSQWPVVLLCAWAGLTGSVLDSLLGATMQLTVFDRTAQRIVDPASRRFLHAAQRQALGEEDEETVEGEQREGEKGRGETATRVRRRTKRAQGTEGGGRGKEEGGAREEGGEEGEEGESIIAGVHVLTNEQVNLVSALMTTVLTGYVGALWLAR